MDTNHRCTATDTNLINKKMLDFTCLYETEFGYIEDKRQITWLVISTKTDQTKFTPMNFSGVMEDKLFAGSCRYVGPTVLEGEVS